MSSYNCENFQLFILYNFQFDHVVLKHLSTVPNSIFDDFCVLVLFSCTKNLPFLRLRSGRLHVHHHQPTRRNHGKRAPP